MLMRAVVMVASALLAAQDATTTFHDLLVEYRCPVVDRLERVYETGDPSSARDRFLSVTVPRLAQAYVQCMFHDNNTKLFCEAASGFYDGPPGAPRTFHQPPEVVAALGRLGFSTDDSAGNFRIDLDVANPPDFNALADFMLRALHDGYGARAQMQLEFNAPFAPRESSKCIAVS